MSRTNTRPRRRWMRRLLLLAVALVCVLLAGVALAPTLISAGFAHGLVERALEGPVRGTVRVDSLELAWFSSQRIDGLQIADPQGQDVARLDIGISAGLAPLLLGAPDEISLSVAGAIHAERRADGSTNIAELLAPESADASAGAAPRTSRRGRQPLVTVRCDDLVVQLHDEQTGQEVALEQLNGSLTYSPGRAASIELAGQSVSDELTGAVWVSGRMDDPLDDRRQVNLSGRAADLDLRVQTMPIPVLAGTARLDELHVTVSSADLTGSIAVSVEAAAALDDDGEPSRLEGQVTFDRLLAGDGSVTFRPEGVTGTLTGERVPTSLLEPLAAHAGIDLARDLGPVVDLQAACQPGSDGEVSLMVKGETFEMAMHGQVDRQSGAVRGDLLHAAGALHPDLVQTATGMTIDQPALVRLDLSSFTIPPLTPGQPLALEACGATGTLSLQAPLALATSEEAEPIARLEALRLEIESTTLGERVHLTGQATIDGAPITIEERMTNLFAEDGGYQPDRASIVGRIEGQAVPVPLLARWLPEQAPLIEAALGETVDGTLATTLQQGGLHMHLEATSPRLQTKLTAVRQGDSVRVQEGRIEMTLTSALLAHLQGEVQEPIRLGAPTRATIDFESFVLQADGQGTLGFAWDEPIRAAVQTEPLLLANVPGVTEPVRFEQLIAMVSLRSGVWLEMAVEGEADVRVGEPAQPLGHLGVDAQLTRLEESPTPSGTVRIDGLEIPALEQALGGAPGTIGSWVGQRGQISTTLRPVGEGAAGTIEFGLPHLTGDVRFTWTDDALTIAGDGARLSLPQAALNDLLASAAPKRVEPQPIGPPLVPPAAPADDAELTVTSDVPVSVSIESCRLPRGLLDGDTFDPAAVEIAMTVRSGAVALAGGRGPASAMRALVGELRSDDLARGVSIQVRPDDNGTTQPAAGDEQGSVTVAGRITGLVAEDATFQPRRGRLDLEASTTAAPTALVDALLGLDGLLVAAVGPQMSATFTAADFSASSGRLDARIDTAHGWLEGSVRGEDGALVTLDGQAIQAELNVTRPLRRRLLASVHPLLADIRSTSAPLRMRLSGTRLPVEGSVKGLQGDIEITVGEVEIDQGAMALSVLDLMRHQTEPTVPGTIEPVIARIRDGVVRYDRFVVHVGPYAMSYEGSIDLNTRRLDLRSQVPLAAVANLFRIEDLGPAADAMVPVLTRGTIDSYKAEVDGDAVLRIAVQAGIEGALQKQAGDDIPIRDILDLITGAGGGKKDGDEKP